MTLQIISAEEIIQFHDRLLRVTSGVAGMPDLGRAEAIMYRVLNKIEYEGVATRCDASAGDFSRSYI